MDQLLNVVKNLGLNEKEAKVYLACLELGSATIQELAEKSGLKRTSIYNFLEGMKQKGLVNEVKKGGKILLIAENPADLEKIAKEQLQNYQNALPQLLGIFNLPGNKPKVKFYQGTEEIKKIYEDILKTGEPICGYSDYEKMLATMDNDYMWNFPKRRSAKQIPFYSIAKDGPKGKMIKKLDKTQLRQTKLVKNGIFETEVNIYGNKVAFVSFRRPYVGVIIEDTAIAQTMKGAWQLLWERL